MRTSDTGHVAEVAKVSVQVLDSLVTDGHLRKHENVGEARSCCLVRLNYVWCRFQTDPTEAAAMSHQSATQWTVARTQRHAGGSRRPLYDPKLC